ncbi:MAG: hypothetical protein RMJ88_16530, partial [Thermogemmata sp.]|nr:hypothetical protein [Thermogemmata sp.]
LDPQTPPAPSSKAAAELTRRLLKWASQCNPDPLHLSNSSAEMLVPPATVASEVVPTSIHHPAPPQQAGETPAALHPDGLEESRFIPLEQVVGNSALPGSAVPPPSPSPSSS